MVSIVGDDPPFGELGRSNAHWLSRGLFAEERFSARRS
jgi:hypothetical protein